MKFKAATSLLEDLWASIRVAFSPTLKGLWQSPALLFHPSEISKLFFANVWKNGMAQGVDNSSTIIKRHLITPNAKGVVLDIGAGHGHTVNYLDHSRVTKYIALEPNTLMHDTIRTRANVAGYTEDNGTFSILSCGAEATAAISHATEPVDTLISILTICTIPNPEQSLTVLVQNHLRSGGQFLFYEHVLSDKEDVAWWQRFWTPLWTLAFDGCQLDRPTHRWISRMRVWNEELSTSWGKEGEDVENLFWHRVGRYTKA